MTESRGQGSNLLLGGAVGEVAPESTTRSPPRLPSDPGSPAASSPRRSMEEMSESDSGSARGTKRKRVTEPRDGDSAGSGSDSSGSPFRRPKAPLMPICTEEDGTVLYGFTDDQDVMDKYHDDMQKYIKKRDRHKRMLTLAPSSVTERRTVKETESVLKCAESILSLSAYLDGKMINQCTGIVVEVDAFRNSAIILTSAWLFCTKKPLDDWTKKEYATEAKVNVHMLDESTLECRLMFFSKHYEIAFFEISGDISLKTMSLERNVELGQDVFLLARDTNLNLIYKRDKVQLVDPCEHQQNHYQFLNGPIPQCGTGGGVLDAGGKIVGMLFYKLPLVAFIPSSLILKCSTMWQHFRQLARPQLGLKLRTLAFLDIPRIELMSRKFSISSGLIVGEISAKCDAEKLGIRAGDIIFSCQKERVSSIVQLEHVLLGVAEEHLEKSNDLSSKVEVEIGVFHVRKRIQRFITLRVELSDHLEVFHSDDEDAKAEGNTGEEGPAAAPCEAKP
ncbi:uncharacterized protein [Lolium perenne]|uniref:uncharacterized protein n=1 Tax=Lolium perenne TaxID=4522 RepID=UPI0021F5177E|nr:uncharacterized protein LOC127292384 [Lolium perenne]XP_051177733.1 uncharacterized protein LOC127292384 [Lolium perenne]XP_051177742.1 uncharacterized protein LOC127292384 [Lolium perenne]XP_051177748.1 uncharacterized protein LOC127292384 [Lolium perenne]XP_051177755.1 uncharacterized protein LOC127292384 [Lolium perenne]